MADSCQRPDRLNFLLQVLQLKGCSSEWIHMWALNSYDVLNFLSQTLQLKGRSALCVRKWAVNWPDCLNFLLQVLQLKGRSSEWMRTQVPNPDDLLNFLSQTLQLTGRSPLCLHKWAIKWLDCLNFLLQVLQLKGRSSEWMRMRTKTGDVLNFLSQTLQLKGRSSEWVRMWAVKSLGCLNLLRQTSHLNGRSPIWMSRCLVSCDDIVNRSTNDHKTDTQCNTNNKLTAYVGQTQTTTTVSPSKIFNRREHWTTRKCQIHLYYNFIENCTQCLLTVLVIMFTVALRNQLKMTSKLHQITIKMTNVSASQLWIW